MAAETVDLERVAFAASINRLVLQIDHELNAFVARHLLEQLIDLLFAQGDWQ